MDIGLNFRGSAGFVTDGANETYCIVSADAYPTVRGGATFGTITGGFNGAADRDATNDRRLAGIGFSGIAPPTQTFRVDLPAAGTYDIHLAIGDAAGGLTQTVLRVLDNTTPLATVTQVSTGAQLFTDATGANNTNAFWPSHEAPISLTFSTAVFQFDVSSDGQPFEGLAHLRIVQAVVGPVPRPFFTTLDARRV